MKINKSQITAVILAGGKGRRLGGQDKGLVEYKGKPLIQHVLEKITLQVDDVLINANRNHESYSALGYKVINDELSDFQGPLAGFATAMQSCNTDYILTMPCDGPSLSDDYVARLATATENKDTIIVAHDGERLQPVHALIPVSLIESLMKFLESGDRKIDRWYAQNDMVTADFSDQPDMFFNVNTEEQRQQKGNNNG
ncbi:MAG: molybdenum cofactor guanylyltransferase [Cocleimonas sp.]|jgi:molybdenum cofactor guanylyltransferase